MVNKYKVGDLFWLKSPDTYYLPINFIGSVYRIDESSTIEGTRYFFKILIKIKNAPHEDNTYFTYPSQYNKWATPVQEKDLESIKLLYGP